jgi:hypothetical protein
MLSEDLGFWPPTSSPLRQPQATYFQVLWQAMVDFQQSQVFLGKQSAPSTIIWNFGRKLLSMIHTL